ncbi:hypothetical protein BDP27DRAFT_1406433 [Rhodocollybia butyracea]|uniref:Uncharacterized protein n=1 Tax=Rhodocollybia butyracea TaxID=206335 RepID=A0A9P5U1U1_9AGAR|nr:hypothetical protein BDP27DRAFT_1406433 [Rhodocollybia butyracea]
MATNIAESSSTNAQSKRSVLLKTGAEVKVNDHVYVSPSWSTRDGTPYSIGRIMEFLKPEGSSLVADSDSLPYTRVRLAWYYRPRDVSDRPGGDSRLLLAAIYSEICDINQVRAKCYVVHRDKISDLAGWKKRPDRFYFTRLFDPYLKKEFEIIQATDVKNIPEDVRNTLIERYEYVAAEKEVIPDLTAPLRLCDTCTIWCSSLESVECDRCKNFFHMRCVQPPLQAKPSRGYGWTCAPCSRRHEEEVDSREVRHTTPNGNKPTPKSNAPAPRGRGRPRKDRTQAEKEENFPVKHFRLWPFRYFGQYTLVEDTLDTEDLIFPRAATRVGPKYQLTAFPENGSSYPNPEDERGADKTVEVLGVLNDFTPSEMTEMEDYLRSITSDEKTSSSVDFLTEVVRQFSDATLNGRSLSSVTLKTVNAPRFEKWKGPPAKHYTDKDWSRDEIIAFEDAIAVHGAELRAVREEVVVRSIYEVVRFYGHWKNSKLGEENMRLRQRDVSPSPGPRMPTLYTSTESDGYTQTIGLSDEESSIIVPPSKAPACGACRTRESRIWWKAPKGLQSNILCDNCGVNYRKYADLNMRQTRDESSAAPPSTKLRNGINGEKREGTPLAGPSSKRSKTASSVTSSTPPPPVSIGPQARCCACSRNGPVGKVIKCKKVWILPSVGTALSADKVDDWRCDLCENEEEQEASIYHDCLLCHRPRGPTAESPSSSYLRACKVTESHGWAHVLCSTFIPEINFTNTTTLKSVEGITGIPGRRWRTECVICHKTGGAVVKCNDCAKEYHVSCAWTEGHTFGFEMQPVKGTRRDNHTTTMFKGETGSMSAIISCRDHNHSRRRIYEICETDDGGESALQVYCRAYKQVTQVSQTHALLRKARRLDQLIAVHAESPEPEPADNNLECSKCRTHFSPRFYHTVMGWYCHSCNFVPTPVESSRSATPPPLPLEPPYVLPTEVSVN